MRSIEGYKRGLGLPAGSHEQLDCVRYQLGDILAIRPHRQKELDHVWVFEGWYIRDNKGLFARAVGVALGGAVVFNSSFHKTLSFPLQV